MTKDREIEAKTLISATTYRLLKHTFPKKKCFWQTNYYFDSPDWFLTKHNIGLRIRLFKKDAEQTMKVTEKSPLQRKFHELIEINDPLTIARAQKIIAYASKKENIVFTGTVGQYLQSHWPNLQLRLFSWGKTKRTLSNGPKNCELTLDQTSYPDGATDYELEIENPQPHLIKGVQTQLEKEFSFHQTKSNSNQNKITRARRHRKDP